MDKECDKKRFQSAAGNEAKVKQQMAKQHHQHAGHVRVLLF
jgi:hypothetical protein